MEAAAEGGPVSLTVSARGVATVLLDRPERGNALSQAMMAGLRDAFERVRTDAGIRILVLRGAGRHFCSGADVSERGGTGPDRIALPDLLATLDALPKPTLAVVQGGCIGGGLALTACCDAVLADGTAFFSLPELRLGLVPTGLMPLFVRALGPRALRRYGISGERIPVADAMRLGIVGTVLDPGQEDAQVGALLDAMLHAAPAAVGPFKKRVAAWAVAPATADGTEPTDPALEAERREGVASFREKRKPAWYPPPD